MFALIQPAPMSATLLTWLCAVCARLCPMASRVPRAAGRQLLERGLGKGAFSSVWYASVRVVIDARPLAAREFPEGAQMLQPYFQFRDVFLFARAL